MATFAKVITIGNLWISYFKPIRKWVCSLACLLQSAGVLKTVSKSSTFIFFWAWFAREFCIIANSISFTVFAHITVGIFQTIWLFLLICLANSIFTNFWIAILVTKASIPIWYLSRFIPRKNSFALDSFFKSLNVITLRSVWSNPTSTSLSRTAFWND